MGNKRKIIFSILKEIEKGEIEPKAEHYGISNAEFGDIVDIMEYEKLIKGSGVHEVEAVMKQGWIST